MNRRTQLGTALVLVSIAMFVAPAFFPVQPVLVHDTRDGTFDGREGIESQGIDVVSYENLSERGQELYVETLENGGEYRVPSGQGASDFTYLTADEREQLRRENPNRQPGAIAIERSDDSQLPRADEPYGDVDEGERIDEEPGRRAQRYDLLHVRKGPPPLDTTPQLLRLAAGVLAVLSFGIGGYLLSSE